MIKIKQERAAGILSILCLIGLMFLICQCNEKAQTAKGSLDIGTLNPRVVLPPGLAGIVSGTTLVIPANPAGAPMVRSFPSYAGVETVGQIGIGSLAGYKTGERVILPVNINLGTEMLDSYTVELTIGDTTAIDVNYIVGNFADLAKKYSTQYDAAEGFIDKPTITLVGDKIIIEAQGVTTATGRINIANVAVDVLGDFPATGVTITFQIVSLKNDQSQDLCTIIACETIDGVAIRRFAIR